MNNLSKIVEKRALVFESLAFENNVSINTEIEKNTLQKEEQQQESYLGEQHLHINSHLLI